MSTVADLLGKKQAKSRYPKYKLPLATTLCGIELEVDDPNNREGVRHPTCISPTWKQVTDGSLTNGYEYVLNAPLAGKQLTNAIYQLFDHGTRTTRTFTGSTHIHVNVIDGMRVPQLKALILMCYYFEDMLYGVGDYSRKWCGFANPLSTIPVNRMKSIFSFNDTYSLQEALSAGRYYGLNLQALIKYGSVEFRYFPTATSAEELLHWLKLVQMFKKAALEVRTPEALVNRLSTEEGVAEFMELYFSEYKDCWHYLGGFDVIQKRVFKSMIITETAKTEPLNVHYSKKFTDTRYGRLLRTKKKGLVSALPFHVHLADNFTHSSVLRQLYPVGDVLLINSSSSTLGYMFTTDYGRDELWAISDRAQSVRNVNDSIDALRTYLSKLDDAQWLAKFEYNWEHYVYTEDLEAEPEPEEDDEDYTEEF